MAGTSKTAQAIVQSGSAFTVTKNSVFNLVSTVINLDNVINASIQISYAFATAPTAGKTIDFYAIYSNDATNYDTIEAATATLLASYALTADTNAQIVTISDIPVSARRMKLGVVTSEVTYDGTINWATLVGTVAR